jgi:ribonuclease D
MGKSLGPKRTLIAELPEQIVNQPAELAACCEHLASCRLFGVDTEFVGEESYHPHLCLVQVATAERLYLVDPLTVGPLDHFWEVMVDPANRVVVHAGREEVRICRLSAGRPPGKLVDLQIAAGLLGLTYPMGHGPLVREVLGISLTKLETRTEWRDRPLTRQQVRYAFDDVRYLLPVWDKLAAELHRRDRLSWAEEEFARLAVQAAAPEAATEKWRKLRGIGSLDRGRLAIVRALHGWREEAAVRANRPARALLRDDLLVEVARCNPRREHDLLLIRGLPRRNARTILEVVERARSLPAAEWPEAAERDLDPSQHGVLVNLLAAVLADWCARQGVASNLTASNQDLKLLVRCRLQGRPLPPESLLAQGWRQAHVLPELLAVLEGRRTIRVADVNAPAPLE